MNPSHALRRRYHAFAMMALFMLVGTLTIPMRSYAQGRESDILDIYDQMRLKYRTYLVGNETNPPADPDITMQIHRITSTAQSYLSTMDSTPGRTVLWSDLAPLTNGPNLGGHYLRLYHIALAYVTPGSPYYAQANTRLILLNAFNFLYSQYDAFTEAHPGSDWFYLQVNIPSHILNIVTMLYTDLTDPLRPQPTITINHYMDAIHKRIATVDAIDVGTNRAWKAMVLFLRGMILKQPARLDLGRSELVLVLAYVTQGDGAYRDGSYVFHATAHTGGYGLTLLKTLSEYAYLTTNTPWALDTGQWQNLYERVELGYVPLMERGAFMDMARGRDIARSILQDHTTGHNFIRALITLGQGGPYQTAFKQWVKQFIPADTYQNFFSNTSIISIIWAKQILTDTSISARERTPSYHHYPTMNRVVQHRTPYAYGISMSSDRMPTYESINQENTKGWHTGSGMTYLYTSDLGQYSDDYWATINKDRLPGTTVTINIPSRPPSYNANVLVPQQNWVGGAALDQYGSAGMYLYDHYKTTLTAKKSWFLFDTEIVALGSDITSTGSDLPYAVETIVENRKLPSTGDTPLTVNGTTKSSVVGWNETMAGVSWMHLAGTGGYYFPTPTAINGLRQARTNTWNDINQYPPYHNPAMITRSFMTLWMNHGTSPTNQIYAYVVLPEQSASAVAQYATKPEITVLEQSSAAHGVREETLNIEAVNFWNDGYKQVGRLSSTRKAAVMTDVSCGQAGPVLDIAVADPTWKNTTTIDLEIIRTASAITRLDPTITITQLSPTIKLTVNVAGSHGQSHRAQLALTPSEDNRCTPLATSGTYDNTSPLIIATGHWTQTLTTTNAFLNTLSWTNAPNATARLSFRGSNITRISSMTPTGGSEDIFIDGVRVTAGASSYAAETRRQVARTWDVPFGIHTIEIKATGPSSKMTDLDSFIVNTPTLGIGLYDDTHPYLSFTGPWTHATNQSGAYNTTRSWSNVVGSTIRAPIVGNRVRYVYTTGPTMGRAAITIDGVDRGYIDLYAPTVNRQQYTTFENLGPGTHMIHITVTGTKHPSATDSIVEIDQLIVE